MILMYSDMSGCVILIFAFMILKFPFNRNMYFGVKMSFIVTAIPTMYKILTQVHKIYHLYILILCIIPCIKNISKKMLQLLKDFMQWFP